MTKIAILGGGSWGTALAIVLSHSRKAHEISLWMRDAALAEAVSASRENGLYLPRCVVPAEVEITNSQEKCLAGARIVIGAMPSAHARNVYARALPFIQDGAAVFVSATKGLEPATHLRMSEVIAQVFADRHAPPIAVLSGPSFALETARGDPTAVVVASQEKTHEAAALPDYLQAEFATPSFRVYTNDDVVGVELAGATKN